MLKKKIIFGSVVLLLAALFALTGCSQATDSDGGTTLYSENHLFGTAEPADVTRAVKSARASGRSLVLTDQLRIVGDGGDFTSVADFGNLPVRVEGRVYVGGTGVNPVIVNAARANLNFEPDAKIDLEDNGSFIYSGDGEHIYTIGTSDAYKIKFVSNALEGAQGTDARIAVSQFQIGSDFSNVANHVTDLYVLDKVTVNAQSIAAGSGLASIFALGEVDLTESNSVVFDPDVFTFAEGSVLTTSAPGSVTIGIVAAGTVLPAIKASRPITVAGPATVTDLVIGTIEGPETVTISAATSIASLRIDSVTESGTAAINTESLTAAGITANAGTVNITASTEITGAIGIGGNTGEISIATATITGGSVSIQGSNAGVLTVTIPSINGTITVANNAANGVINLNAADDVATAVTVTNNAGKLNYATPEFDTGGSSTVTTNTGEINFTQDFESSIANFLVVPSNKGVINFKGELTTGEALGALPGSPIAGPGKVVFGGLATFGGATIIGSATEFNAGLTKTATNAALTLNGDVTLAYEQTITLPNAADTLTLGPGARLLVGTNPVLAAGNNPVTITPTAGAVLTAGTELPGDNDDAETFVGNRALTLSDAGIEVSSGELKVAGALIVDVADGVSVTGGLTLENGGILGFPNNAAANTFTVTFGYTKIAGVNNAESRLTASGGPVSLTPNRISGGGSTLTVVPNLAGPVITVDDGSGAILTLTGVDLDLYGDGSGPGSLVLPNQSTPNKVVLSNGQNPGKITLGLDTLYTIGNLNGKTIADDGSLTGGGVVLGDNEALPTTVGELSATESSNLTITGDLTNTSPVTLTAGVQVDP